MSYRIHIGVINKKAYKEYLKEYKKSKNEDKCFDMKTPIEISDNTDIEQFKNIPIKKKEYHPKILNKKDFKKILISYQNLMLEISEDRLKKIVLIKESYWKENESNEMNKLSKVTNEAVDLINRLQTDCHYTQWFFERLQKNDILISDSDHFKFQYFYLVKVYETFNDKTDVLILTHG